MQLYQRALFGKKVLVVDWPLGVRPPSVRGPRRPGHGHRQAAGRGAERGVGAAPPAAKQNWAGIGRDLPGL